ncbi:MAG: hypothetical protein KOO62_08420 [candidate division Zixibacteria bacterium]|nr:hypothetical protein [candidate division Zixibacteria bacterium]
MKWGLQWITGLFLTAFCANIGSAEEILSTHMKLGDSPDSLTESQLGSNHARTQCLIRQVGNTAELNSKMFRNNLTGTLQVGSDFSTQMKNTLITYSEDSTLDNNYPVKIGSELYLLVMEKSGDQIDIDGGILGIGTRLRFSNHKWTSFLGSQYRNGGCLIDSQGLQLLDGTEERDETSETQAEVIQALEAADSVLSDTITPRHELPGKFPSEVGKHLFTFKLSNSGSVDILIMDLSGKKLRKLTCGRLVEGTNSIPWDGLDNSGHLLSAGLYMYEIRVDGKVIVQDRLMLRVQRD